MKILFLAFLTLCSLFATNLSLQKTTIFDLQKDTAKIDIPNLTIGQSGVIVKTIENDSIIIAQAFVVAADTMQSTIRFTDKQILPQDAIPTSSKKPAQGDEFILNHLYNTSLLIVPNTKAKEIVQSLYPKQNFLDEDFFATHLKLIYTPIPNKKDFLNFAQKQQIGTLFIVVQNQLYILDAATFKLLDTIAIDNDDQSENIPFLTKITEIEKGFWDFGDNKIDNYTQYYSKLLEIKK